MLNSYIVKSLEAEDMRLDRRSLRRLIESVINEQEGNPGDLFRTASDAGDKHVKDESRQKQREALQKTYDWFVYDVFPKLEKNQWPIVADDNYHVVHPFDDRTFSMIPKDSVFDSKTSTIKIKGGDTSFLGGSEGEMTLLDYWDKLLNVIEEDEVDIPLTSSQEPSLEKIKNDNVAQDSSKDIKPKLEDIHPSKRKESIPGVDYSLEEGVSHGSLYRRRYRRY